MNEKKEHQNESLFLDYPDIISHESIQTISKQMESCICRITAENKSGTGLFCKVPFPDLNNKLPVLITNNHVINEELLLNTKAKIGISTKDGKYSKEISFLGKKSITFSEDEYDITIIEIREEDNIKNFLELDDIIINDIIKDENNNNKFENQSIYIIQYPNRILSVSFGRINGIKSYQLIHRCNTEKGSSGSPILKLNNKVIGVHKWGGSESKPYNFGTFLTDPVKKFIEKYHSNSKRDKNLTHVKNIEKEKSFKIHLGEPISSKHLTQIINKFDKYNNNGRRVFTPIKQINKQNSFINQIPKPTKNYQIKIADIRIEPLDINTNIIRRTNIQNNIEVSKIKYRRKINELNKIYALKQPMQFIKYIIKNYKYKNYVNSEVLFENKSLEKIIDIISPEYNPDYYNDKDDVGIYHEIFILLALIKANIERDNKSKWSINSINIFLLLIFNFSFIKKNGIINFEIN